MFVSSLHPRVSHEVRVQLGSTEVMHKATFPLRPSDGPYLSLFLGAPVLLAEPHCRTSQRIAPRLQTTSTAGCAKNVEAARACT